MPTYEELLEIIAEQNKIIERLTAELASAKAEIAELKEKMNKNSRNSSKPPSTDGYEKPAPKSLRKKSGKKAGGQTGHKGHSIVLDKPDRIERIYPEHCKNCPHRDSCANLKVNDSCYVVDITVKKEIGTFRSEQGAKDFLTLKSLTSTAAKSGITAFNALLSLFHGLLALGD